MFDITKCRHSNANAIDGQLILDSQEIDALLDNLGCNLLDITGAIVETDEDGYSDVWLTQSSQPYHNEAIYFLIS